MVRQLLLQLSSLILIMSTILYTSTLYTQSVSHLYAPVDASFPKYTVVAMNNHQLQGSGAGGSKRGNMSATGVPSLAELQHGRLCNRWDCCPGQQTADPCQNSSLGGAWHPRELNLHAQETGA